MKKFLAVMMFAGFASVSQGAQLTLSCTPNPQVILGGSGGGPEVCDTSGLAALDINFISVYMFFDVLGTEEGATASFDFAGPSGISFIGIASVTNPQEATVDIFDQAVIAADWLGASVVFNESFVGSDQAEGGLFFKRITVDYNSGQVPEPGSMALLGGGLLGLGIIARRRRSRR